MATLANILVGFEIAAAHSKKGMDAHLAGAGHDEIGLPLSDNAELSDLERQKMYAAGWFPCPDNGVWMIFC